MRMILCLSIQQINDISDPSLYICAFRHKLNKIDEKTPMRSTELNVPSRKDEEAHIACHWLQHIQEALDVKAPNLFFQAIYKAGISQDDYKNATNIHWQQVDIVEQLAEQHLPDINVLLYKNSDLLDLGLMGYAILSSGTIDKALKITQEYHELTTDRYQLVLDIEDREVSLKPIPHIQHFNEYQAIAEDCITGLSILMHQIIGADEDFTGASANFAFPSPEYASTFHEVIPFPVHFDSTHTELRFPKKWLSKKVASANTAAAGLCASMCDRLIGESRSSSNTLESVRRLLLSRPGQHMLSLEEAADELHLSVSQLRKRLYRIGTSYKKVVLNVRMTLARHYLEATDLSVQEIAYFLDYTQPAPFSRAFKSYYGVSPQQSRNNSRH